MVLNGNYELRFLFKSDLKVRMRGVVRIAHQPRQKVGVGTAPNARKNPYLVLGFYVQDWR
jgi:hypothetical protein